MLGELAGTVVLVPDDRVVLVVGGDLEGPLSEVNLIAAVLAGAASFLSPCVLPLLPGYISLMSGYSLQELSEGNVSMKRVVGMTALFALHGKELPLDVLNRGALTRKKICRTFSDCTTAPRNGLISGCYPLDEFYKKSAEAEKLRKIKEGL